KYDNSDGLYKFEHRIWAGVGSVAWTDAGEINSNPDNIYGCVLRLSGTTIYMGYLHVTNSNVSKIFELEWEEGDVTAPLIGSSTLIASGVYYGSSDHAFRTLFGPALMIDPDGTQIFAYLKNNVNNIYVTIGGSEQVAIADKDVDNNAYNDFSKVSNWNIVVKSGVLYVFYCTLNKGSGAYKMEETGDVSILFEYWQIKRKALIFDSADQDFLGAEIWFDSEIVEDQPIGNSYLNTYQKHETDSMKRISYIKYFAYPNSVTCEFRYIRQDRGVLAGAVELVQKAVIRYDARQYTDDLHQGVGGVAESNVINLLERLDVIQCDNDRFYFRHSGVMMWRLLEGQMDETNSFIKNRCVIDGKAFLWVKNNVLRAGCGTGTGFERTPPIFYDLVDRFIYNNDAPRLRARRLNFADVKPHTPTDTPVYILMEYITTPNPDGEEPQVGLIEPPGTDTDDDNERYARFSATDADGSDNLTPSYHMGPSFPEIGIPQHAPPNRVEHPYKNIAERVDVFGTNSYVDLKQPYIEGFLGYALRYDNGQISQILPIQGAIGGIVNEPIKLGWEVTDIDDDNVYVSTLLGRMLKVTAWIKPWNFDANTAMNPRVSSIMYFWGMRDKPATTRLDANYRLIKEVFIAKKELFKDHEWDGDSPWELSVAFGVSDPLMKIVTFIDFKTYQKIYRVAENAVDMIGHGVPVYEDEKAAWLEGYKYADSIGDRLLYGNIKMNGQIAESDLRYSGYGVSGGEAFPTPDVVGIESVRRMPFKLMGVSSFGDETIIGFGDTDIEWGRVLQELRQWQWRGTRQDLGVLSPDSITKIAESAQAAAEGKFHGLSFLSVKSGLRFFNPYVSTVMARDINENFEDFRNPSGTRTLTTRKGILELAAADAMVIHLPEYELLFVHFPTDGVTWVRDFKAEAYIRGGGQYWTEWSIGKPPTAWCVAPEGYLLYTDGNQLYKWDAGSETDDGGVAIECEGRIANIPSSMVGIIIPARLAVSYDLYHNGDEGDPALVIDVLKDDGQKLDNSISFPLTRTTSTPLMVKKQKGFGQSPGRANQSLSLAWSLTNPLNVAAFHLHGLFLKAESYNDF
ncbi:hypothetical protein LCGC14_1461060, partial [marine sediment metagenome]